MLAHCHNADCATAVDVVVATNGTQHSHQEKFPFNDNELGLCLWLINKSEQESASLG